MLFRIEMQVLVTLIPISAYWNNMDFYFFRWKKNVKFSVLYPIKMLLIPQNKSLLFIFIFDF